MKMGPSGCIAHCDNRYLCDAFASYAGINQLNHHEGMNVCDKMIQNFAKRYYAQAKKQWQVDMKKKELVLVAVTMSNDEFKVLWQERERRLNEQITDQESLA